MIPTGKHGPPTEIHWVKAPDRRGQGPAGGGQRPAADGVDFVSSTRAGLVSKAHGHTWRLEAVGAASSALHLRGNGLRGLEIYQCR